MIDAHTIVSLERLRDDLGELKKALRKRYPAPSSAVKADDLRHTAARLAEVWMVDFNPARHGLGETLSSDYLGDLSIHFQRLLTLSEMFSQRKIYESVINSILHGFTVQLIVPLKQLERQEQQTNQPRPIGPKEAIDAGFSPHAFVGHSFDPTDATIVRCVIDTLESIGITVTTGRKPQAEHVSEKVKQRIDAQYLFVGIFTRRKQIAQSSEWTTSAWLIDEKAYAVGKGKKLILLKEKGVESIGGIQGDYEYLEFTREGLQDLVAAVLSMFNVVVIGLS